MLMLAAAGVGLESQMARYRHPGVIVRPVADAPATETFLVTPERPSSEALSRFLARVRQIEYGTRLH
jgi:hypothetical protein